MRLHLPGWFWIVFCALLVVGTAAWVVFGSTTFRITQIEVLGSVNEEVRLEVEQLRGTNILTYSTSGMTARLKSAQSSIEELSISKGLPNTLRVAVTLREPVARWERGGELYLLDKDGVAFQYASGSNMDEAVSTLPRIVDIQAEPVVQGKKMMSRQFMQFIAETSAVFTDQFPIALDHFEIGQTSFEATLVTVSNWKVLLDTTRSPRPQLDSLQQVFEHFHDDIHEYVDLRVSGRAYFK